MVRFLLRAGADVNISTGAGYTPLHQAAQQGHTLVINLLLESKAKPNAVTNVRTIEFSREKPSVPNFPLVQLQEKKKKFKYLR